jgi:hypothetical protein
VDDARGRGDDGRQSIKTVGASRGFEKAATARSISCAHERWTKPAEWAGPV